MKRLLKAACLLMCFLFCATAFAANVTGVSILEYGLYTYDEKVIVVEDKQGSTKLSNIRLIKQTLDIPLRENTFFSIKYILESPKPNQDVDIELRVTNPGGETNTGTVTTRTGQPTITNIEFTEKDTPGVYLLQILSDGNVLLSRNINLLTP